MKQSNYDKVRSLTGWHKFIGVLLNNEKEKFSAMLNEKKTDYMNYHDLRMIGEHNDKLKFLTDQYYDAEMDLIGAAIKYNVPHTRLLETGRADDFYTLLEEKARAIDNGEVVRISRI